MAENTENTANLETPPEVAGEAPPEDPSVIGSLEINEIQALNFLRQQSTQVTMRIGQLEVEKSGLIGRLSDFERQAQEAMQGVGKRLKIQDGTQWQVGMDGKVRVVQPTQPPQAPKARKLELVGPDGKNL